MEETCSYEEAREVFENDRLTVSRPNFDILDFRLE